MGTGSSSARPSTRTSASCSIGRSARTRVCSSRSRKATSRSRLQISCASKRARYSMRISPAAPKRTWRNISRRRRPGRRRTLPADARRLRLCERIRRRAQVSRDAPVSGRADLDESDPVLRGRARARLASFVLRARYASTRGHHRRCHGARHRGAVLHASACRSRRASHQDRAAWCRRLCAELRRPCAWARLAFRLDQSLEGESDARREASGGRANSSKLLGRAPMCWCRTSGRAPRRASGCPTTHSRQTSAAHRVRHLRLWRYGSVS